MKKKLAYIELDRQLKLLPKYFKEREKIYGIFFHLNFDYMDIPIGLFLILPFVIYSFPIVFSDISEIYKIIFCSIIILVHLSIILLMFPRITHRWLGFDVIILSDLKIYNFFLYNNKHSMVCVPYTDITRVELKDPEQLNNLQTNNTNHVNLFKQKGRIEVFNTSNKVTQTIWVYHYFSVFYQMIKNFVRDQSTMEEYFKDNCSSQELQDLFVQLHPCHTKLIQTLDKRQQALEKEYQEYKQQYESFAHKSPLILTSKLNRESPSVPLSQPITIYQRFFLPEEHLLYHYVTQRWENGELLFTDKQLLVYVSKKLYIVPYPKLRLLVGKKIAENPPKYKFLGLAWNLTPTSPEWASVKIYDIPQDTPILYILGNFDIPMYNKHQLIIGSEPLEYAFVKKRIPIVDSE